MATMTPQRMDSPTAAQLALVDIPDTALTLKTPTDIVDEYCAIRDMKGELEKEQKMLSTTIKSWFKQEASIPESQKIGSHTVAITWRNAHGESSWEKDALFAYLQGKGLLDEVVSYQPVVDPVKLANAFKAGKLTKEELQPFVKPPTPTLTVK